MMEIKTFGPVDERSRKQLETCMKAGDAEFGVLCADHHPGYSQPIGGAVAYEGYVSPSGVGYDIACVAAGTPVTMAEGYSLPVEEVAGSDQPRCWDTVELRGAASSAGAVRRGERGTVRVSLENDRSVVATPDHRFRVKTGWKEAGKLAPGEHVACVPFVGLMAELRHGVLDVSEPTEASRRRARARLEDLNKRGLWPVRLEDGRTPALVRLLGHNCGDGHLSTDRKRVSFFTHEPGDAATMAADLRIIGFEPRRHDRPRPSGGIESHVYVGSVALHALLAAMGAPVGRKAWPAEPMPWLFEAPAWIRAQFLSAFASAEATTPTLVDGRIPDLAIKQTGDNTHAARFVARLLASLGFTASDPAPNGPGRGEWQSYVVQLLGGEREQLRYLEEIGFCYARRKRVEAARVASVCWQRQVVVRRRQEARHEARAIRRAGGGPVLASIAEIAERRSVSRSFVHHAWYERDRGRPRAPKGVAFEPDHSGEVAWVPVREIAAAGVAPVFDVVTGDPAESFLVNGVVVHNCGNKAVLTDARREDLDAPAAMKEISERISFGMGVPAKERVEHPVLDRIRDAPFEPQRQLLDLARKQLGTVGSGNHFVNLFADEEDRVWVGVHFGSRGFGHKTATGFLALAQGLPFGEGERKRLGLKVTEGEMDSPPVLLALESEAGQSYIEAMQLAGEYAYAGRDVVVDKVLEILGAESLHVVHNHHNFAWLEEHFGRKVWVVRKGCTPAEPGQEGFVGATMGDDSVILEGVEDAESTEALYSTVHGAGRVMSRTQAAGKVRRRKRFACMDHDCDRVFEQADATCPDHPCGRVRKVWIEEQVRPGKVDWPAVRARMRDRGIVLVGGGADEAPEVYKRLPEVLGAHGNTIRVKHTLTPLGVAMAGRDVFDPYKD
jgi:tRNA-splicing ligase RtcB (3'-phosphate/5'-hydroxy nucleic acid ligase)